MASGNKPVHEIRLRLVKATIWMNPTEQGHRYNVSLSKLYKDGDQWKESNGFGRDDLQLVAKVADMAHTWIFQHADSLEEAAA